MIQYERFLTPGWHSGDCASFVMRNYQGFESLTRLHRKMKKKTMTDKTEDD